MGWTQSCPSGLTLPRESTPKLTHCPLLKYPWSKALEPESPSQVLSSPDTNSLAERTCSATEALGPAKQLRSGVVVSFGMQARGMFSLMRRTPAVTPASSVGVSIPYPMAVPVVEETEEV